MTPIPPSLPIVTTDFPGGNGIVDSIDGNHITIKQDPRDTEGDWFYWYVRLQATKGSTLTLKLNHINLLTVNGPATSTDGGDTWQYQPDSVRDEQTIELTFPQDCDTLDVSMGMPYTRRHWDAFSQQHSHHDLWHLTTLCQTRGNRDLPWLHLGNPKHATYRVAISARHHCCEMIPNYSIEGIIDSYFAEDELGAWLREHVAFAIVPFMDTDGVEAGDQGKNRRPHDHNRDYGEESIYPEIAAYKTALPAWANHGQSADNPAGLDIGFDLHCPWIKGQHNDNIYQVGQPDPAVWHAQQHFAKALANVQSSELVYDPSHDLPFGESWNTAAQAGVVRNCGSFYASFEGIKLASTWEIPYAVHAGKVLTQDNVRAFGRDLALGIRAYLGK